MQDVARRKLKAIDAAKVVDDLRVPPVTDSKTVGRPRRAMEHPHQRQWRACFRFEDGGAHDVEITDCH